MTEQMISFLMGCGLSKQQATSVTANTIIDSLVNKNEDVLIAEAKAQVDECRKIVYELKVEATQIRERITKIYDVMNGIAEAENKYGEVKDEKAREALALYAALMNIGQNSSEELRIQEAGYITYAYLGGQAKREITYSAQQTNDDYETVSYRSGRRF